MIHNNSNGKSVVITGATKGLGRALSITFAKAGCEIIGIYRSDAESARRLELEFEANGWNGSFIQQDICQEGEWPGFIEILLAREFNNLVLIANACTPFTPKPIHLIEWAEILEQINVNVKGTFLTAKQLIPSMVKARQGTIVSVLSSALDPPSKGFAAYIAAKSALDGLTKSMAAEYSPRGVRVFSVSPGLMDTAFVSGWSEHLTAALSSRDGGLQEPDDVADAIFDLVQDTTIGARGENYAVGNPATTKGRSSSA